MAFRKIVQKCDFPILSEMKHLQMKQVQSDIDGNIVVKSELLEVPAKEISKSIPDYKDYQLNDLLAAGIPLQQVNCNLLNPRPEDLLNSNPDLVQKAINHMVELSPETPIVEPTPVPESPIAPEPTPVPES